MRRILRGIETIGRRSSQPLFPTRPSRGLQPPGRPDVLDRPACPEAFRYLDRTLPGVEANLALDEALLIQAEAESGPPVLRTWELPTVAVVRGASCRLREEVGVEACRADGVAIARRSSGG